MQQKGSTHYLFKSPRHSAQTAPSSSQVVPVVLHHSRCDGGALTPYSRMVLRSTQQYLAAFSDAATDSVTKKIAKSQLNQKLEQVQRRAGYQGASSPRARACADTTLQLPLLPRRSCVTTSSSRTSNSICATAAAAAGGHNACASASQALDEAGRTHRPTVT
jgi:hypothetical protein